MINTNFSTASTLSGIYTKNSNALAESLSKLASGKRVQSASDDFAGYLKASGYNSNIEAYNVAKQNIQDAKGMMDYAKTVGNQVVTNLTRMNELESLSATADATQNAAYSAEYSALKTSTTNLISAAKYNGTSVYAAATLTTVTVNPESSTTIAATTTNSASAAGLTFGGGAVAAQLSAAQTFLAEVTSFGKQFEAADAMADSAIAGKKAAVSAIVDVNEVVEMSNMTNLQVRNSAAVSMMSQANMSQQGLARLFM